MKREFLENFKVNGEAMPKEIVDAIMAENGNDIENAKKPFKEFDNIKDQLKTAKEQLEAFKDVDVNDLKGQIEKLQGDLAQKDTDFAAQLADRDFQDTLKAAIGDAHGKNATAIMALLDLDALKGSKNQENDIKSAIEACKKDNDYLFGGTQQTPPPFSGAAGAGNNNGGGDNGVFGFHFTGIRPHEK